MVAVGIGAGLLAMSSIRATVLYATRLGVPFFDWTFYASAVDRWLAGQPIYPGGRISTLGSAAGSSYSYPPASVPLMLPFASWPVGAILWETLIVGLLLLGLWRITLIGWPNQPLIAFGIELALMSQLEGVIQGIALGNVNIATAGAIGLVWAGTRSVAPLAAWLGVVKVFPLAIAAPAGLPALRRATGIALGICLVTLPLVGIDSWLDYASGLRASVPLCGDPTWVNYSLACQVSPMVGPTVAKYLGLVVAGALTVIAIRAGLTFPGMAAAALAIMAPATELHAHYLALVFVVAVIGMATLSRRRVQRGNVALVMGPRS